MGMVSGVRKLLSHRAPVLEPSPDATMPEAPETVPVVHASPEAERVIDGVDIAGLAEAIKVAKIARVLFVGGPDANRRGGVLLARALAAAGASTVLVDMGRDGHAAWDMGVIDRAEDVRTLAASPTTFADSIHRDRRSRAHVMAASLESEEAGKEAARAVFVTLTQAYARSVLVFDDVPFHLLSAIVDDNTALVLPEGDGGPAGGYDPRGRLAELGIGEPVVLVLPVPIEQTRAA